ncbi:MAG: M67 family metallopeptidase [Anaerolineales bacterium]
MTTLVISAELLEALSTHLEAAYPDEGAGFLFGVLTADQRHVRAVFPLPNRREAEARHNRFLITAQDYAQAEQRAAEEGFDVIGVFHSHPDSPNVPSEFDRQWALPYFAYWITTVNQGKCAAHRVWLLREDRASFVEISFRIVAETPPCVESNSAKSREQNSL